MKNENRGRDIFYGIVAIATLIVAIVGATLAYFSISTSSNEGAVNAMSANVSISYDDGKQVTAQADELIPSSLDIVKRVYEDRVMEETDLATEDTANLCIDDNNLQVCSVYRFTVSSNITREIAATLNNEENGFEYLSYAVYDVSGNNWLKIGSDGSESLNLNKCSNESETESEHCNTVDEDGVKKYASTAVNSIFGIKIGDTGTPVFQTKKLELPAEGTKAEQTYDLILFIKETNDNQNVDQGKKYRGTIVVDVSGNGSGNITGFLNPENQ